MRIGLVRMVALGTLLVGAASLQVGGHAVAQDGAACDEGPADYRECCKQSFAKKPKLSEDARDEDIDACMSQARGGAAGQKPGQQKDDDDDSDENERE